MSKEFPPPEELAWGVIIRPENIIAEVAAEISESQNVIWLPDRVEFILTDNETADSERAGQAISTLNEVCPGADERVKELSEKYEKDRQRKQKRNFLVRYFTID